MAKKTKTNLRQSKTQTKLLLLFAIIFAGIGVYLLRNSFAATGGKYYVPLKDIRANVGYGPTTDTATIKLVKETTGALRGSQVAEVAISINGFAFRQADGQLADEVSYQNWFKNRASKSLRGCVKIRVLDNTTINITNLWTNPSTKTSTVLSPTSDYQIVCSNASINNNTVSYQNAMWVGVSNDPSKIRVANWYIEER